MAAKHDKKEAIDKRQRRLTEVSFDIIVFDSGWQTQSPLEKEIVCSALIKNIPRIYKFNAKLILKSKRLLGSIRVNDMPSPISKLTNFFSGFLIFPCVITG